VLTISVGTLLKKKLNKQKCFMNALGDNEIFYKLIKKTPSKYLEFLDEIILQGISFGIVHT
jgi:hypothetical protein